MTVNRVGLGSIVATAGITASVEAGLIGMIDSWGMTDTALVVSTAVSVMFFFKLRMDYKKTKLEIELMKKKAEQDDNEQKKDNVT